MDGPEISAPVTIEKLGAPDSFHARVAAQRARMPAARSGDLSFQMSDEQRSKGHPLGRNPKGPAHKSDRLLIGEGFLQPLAPLLGVDRARSGGAGQESGKTDRLTGLLTEAVLSACDAP